MLGVSAHSLQKGSMCHEIESLEYKLETEFILGSDLKKKPKQQNRRNKTVLHSADFTLNSFGNFVTGIASPQHPSPPDDTDAYWHVTHIIGFMPYFMPYSSKQQEKKKKKKNQEKKIRWFKIRKKKKKKEK